MNSSKEFSPELLSLLSVTKLFFFLCVARSNITFYFLITFIYVMSFWWLLHKSIYYFPVIQVGRPEEAAS